MTPFGAKVRACARSASESLQAMAEAIGVSAAYLSALEHGKRGKPTWLLLQRIIAHFNVIWDEAEDLQRLAEISDPRIVVDTAKLSPAATELANRLARDIAHLSDAEIAAILSILKASRRR